MVAPGHCLTTIGEVIDADVSQAGPTKDFVYLDIGSVDRESKTFFDLKSVSLNETPSRARQVVQLADVLVSMTRPNLNAIAMVTDLPGQAIASTGFHVLRSPWLEPRFLYYLVQTEGFVQAMTAVVQGALYPAVRPKDISSFQFNLPPCAEQSRIVEKLEELLSDLDAGVAELKAAQRKLAQYRQSLLKAAVEGALTADWRAARAATLGSASRRKPGSSSAYSTKQEQKLDPGFRRDDGQSETGADLLQRILNERRARWEHKQLARFAEKGKTPPKNWQAKYPEPVTPDLADLPPLPEGWVWASVDQISLAQKYGSSAKTNEDSSGVPVLRMGNIRDGELDLSSLKYLPSNHAEFPDLFLDDGDLLFNRTNSPELVGKTAIYRSQSAPCSYASYLIAVKLSSWCIPELISAFINSAYGRQWVKSVVTQQVGQANVNGTKLAALAVPLAPYKEQQVIAQILSEQRANTATHEAMIGHGLKQASAQRKNLLKAAFAGQLVPQDPADEPASVLLARIRADREAKGATARKRGRKAKETA